MAVYDRSRHFRSPYFHLWLFGSGSQTWGGRLFSLSLYNITISFEMAKYLYSIGLTNSLPVVWNTTIRVQQHGIVNEHYDTPIYYHTEVPVKDLVSYELPCYDFDNKCSSVVYLSLPRYGRLYNPITLCDIVANRIYNTIMVKYRPHMYNHSIGDSIFDYFVFKAFDDISNATSLENATVSVIVQAINLPPISTQGSDITINRVRSGVSLTGVDYSNGHISGSSKGIYMCVCVSVCVCVCVCACVCVVDKLLY